MHSTKLICFNFLIEFGLKVFTNELSCFLFILGFTGWDDERRSWEKTSLGWSLLFWMICWFLKRLPTNLGLQQRMEECEDQYPGRQNSLDFRWATGTACLLGKSQSSGCQGCANLQIAWPCWAGETMWAMKGCFERSNDHSIYGGMHATWCDMSMPCSSQHVLGTRLNFCEKNDAFFFACDFRFFLFSGQDVCVCVRVLSAMPGCGFELGGCLTWYWTNADQRAREKQLFAFSGRLSWVL